MPARIVDAGQALNECQPPSILPARATQGGCCIQQQRQTRCSQQQERGRFGDWSGWGGKETIEAGIVLEESDDLTFVINTVSIRFEVRAGHRE
jgi:hypothetical protein